MDLAVAFVGQDWRDAIADFSGRLRVVCWLSSTNTNPYAVRQMMRDDRVEVRQRDAMHAKVYVGRTVGAVVGSANLSRRALDSADVSGQHEAAVLLHDAANRSAIGRWFGRLWDDAAPITRGDLDRAVEAYKRARAAFYWRWAMEQDGMVWVSIDNPWGDAHGKPRPYHREGCSFMSVPAMDNYWHPVPMASAQADGREPCSRCRP
jgi:hypothetical protein